MVIIPLTLAHVLFWVILQLLATNRKERYGFNQERS